MIYHIASMLAGFLMDLLLGDPYWLPHPIRLIGNWISFLEKRLLGIKTEEKHTTPEQEQRRGMLLVLAVLSSTVFVTAVLLLGAYRLHPYLGAVIESIMTYQILATKCLKVESMKVYQELLPSLRRSYFLTLNISHRELQESFELFKLVTDAVLIRKSQQATLFMDDFCRHLRNLVLESLTRMKQIELAWARRSRR